MECRASIVRIFFVSTLLGHSRIAAQPVEVDPNFNDPGAEHWGWSTATVDEVSTILLRARTSGRTLEDLRFDWFDIDPIGPEVDPDHSPGPLTTWPYSDARLRMSPPPGDRAEIFDILYPLKPFCRGDVLISVAADGISHGDDYVQVYILSAEAARAAGGVYMYAMDKVVRPAITASYVPVMSDFYYLGQRDVDNPDNYDFNSIADNAAVGDFRNGQRQAAAYIRIVVRDIDEVDICRVTLFREGTYWPDPVGGLRPHFNETDVTRWSPQLSWAGALYAASYDVYFGRGSQQLAFRDNTTETSWVIPEKLDPGTYYYWRVDSRNSCGAVEGDVSRFVTCHDVARPTGLEASQGTYCDKVHLNWDRVDHADTFWIYRGSTLLERDWATRAYDDLSAPPGFTHRYKVFACGACGCGEFSDAAEGWLNVPGQPDNIGASDGAHCDKVRVTWDAAYGAAYYKVYRNETRIGGDIVGTSYDDGSAVAGTTYSYTVKAHNDCGDSTASDSDSGHATCTECTYSVSPASSTVPTSGGSESFAVTTASGCSWTAVSNRSWITITSGSNGSGNGTVSYSVSSNSSPSARTGTITAGGNSHTVSQFGLEVSDFHPADEQQSWANDCGSCTPARCGNSRIETCELLKYMAAWKRGDHDDSASVLRSIYLWKSGECYTWSDPEQRFVPDSCGSPSP